MNQITMSSVNLNDTEIRFTGTAAGPVGRSFRREPKSSSLATRCSSQLFPVTKGIHLLGITLSSLGEKLESGAQLRLSF